ncbi:acetyl-CoA synthetase-like protein [Gautieria morchelliformis]|nr:acetyl-CoA synthetase-like protein [Gautieria morchelliformis]
MPLHPECVLYPANFDYTRQSIELPGTRKPGQTGIYRNAAWPELLNFDSPHSRRSLPEIFESGLAHSPNAPCIGHRPVISTTPLKFAPYYSWQTYTEVDERRRNLGSALEFLWQHGRAGGGDLPTLGLWSLNRPEWQIVDLAAQAYAKVSVSLYDTLGPTAVAKLNHFLRVHPSSCNHSEISLVFVSNTHLPSILALAPRLKNLKIVVALDEPNPETRLVTASWAKQCNLEYFSLKELEALGKANIREPIIASPEQIYSICYTSVRHQGSVQGTTGNPKGVILTHGQCAIAVLSAVYGKAFYEPGVLLSYLPLAHIYGRISELITFNMGGAVGYFTGDTLRILEDAQILKPTAFPSVPRLLNKIYQAANAAGDVPGLKGNIFRKAVSVKLANLHATGQVTHALWDRIVFKKVQRVLGGAIDNMVSGSAPISADAIDFLKIAFACEVDDGAYGLTETTAICTRTVVGDPQSAGTVGPPMPAVEIKLVDVPSMNYTSEDKPGPRGELCLRGLACTKGYYKDPTNTAAAIDEEGWLHTGDIGQIDTHGRISIIDRLKNIMKLAQGEYVALEKIENAYSALPTIAQIYVHGDSLQDHLVAIVIPDMDHLAGLASKLGGKQVQPSDHTALEAVAGDERVKAAFMIELDKQAKKVGLKGFECVKKIHLSVDPFTPENDMLTPTLKLKRREVQKVYKEVLDALYRQPLRQSFKL